MAYSVAREYMENINWMYDGVEYDYIEFEYRNNDTFRMICKSAE
jgi:hypothetical protein